MRHVTETEVLEFVASGATPAARGLTFIVGCLFEEPYSDIDGLDIAIEVPRENIGLTPGKKPGDIDLLVIPWKGDRHLYTHCFAVEAKMVRPTLRRADRNANTYGVIQARGLVKDGFPFVALMHLVVPEPLPEELCWDVPIMEADGPQLRETGRAYFDYFPWAALERQGGRMKQFDLPGCVGAHAFTVGLTDKYEFNLDLASGGGVKAARLNVDVNPKTVQAVKNHHIEYRAVYKHVPWYPFEPS